MFVTGLYDGAVVGVPIEQRGGRLGVAEHACPLAKGANGDGETDAPTPTRRQTHLKDNRHASRAPLGLGRQSDHSDVIAFLVWASPFRPVSFLLASEREAESAPTGAK